MGWARTISSDFPLAAEWPEPRMSEFAIPSQTYSWMYARAAVSQLSGLRCFGIRGADSLVAVAPLLEVGDWLRELPALYEPGDLIWSDSDALAELASLLAAQPQPVYLERVPVNSPTRLALRRAYAGKGIILERPAMPTPFINLNECDGNIDATFNAIRRSDFRRAERKAGEFGMLTYELHAPNSITELASLMNEVHAVEAASWKEQEGSSLTANTWQGNFFHHFTQGAMLAGILRIAIMRISGQAVAIQVAVEWQQRFWLFKISYDQHFSRCSPGQLLMLYTLRYAAQEVLQSYEFMGVMSPWTAYWTKQTRSYVQLRAIPFSIATGKHLVRWGGRSILSGFRRVLA
jgi:hypothetical protein